jgi:hypothetical protein
MLEIVEESRVEVRSQSGVYCNSPDERQWWLGPAAEALTCSQILDIYFED